MKIADIHIGHTYWMNLGPRTVRAMVTRVESGLVEANRSTNGCRVHVRPLQVVCEMLPGRDGHPEPDSAEI